MSEDAVAKITEILGEFHEGKIEVTENTSFEDLGLDSLDVVELSVKIEDAFGIDIDEDDLENVRTVGDAANLVRSKLASV